MKQCVLIFAFCLATVFGMGSARAAGCDMQHVTGRWKLVPAKANDKPDPTPQEATSLLIIVPGYATTVDYDAAGRVTNVNGGAVSFSGDAAHWTPEFRLKDEGQPPLKQDLQYSCDLQGNRIRLKADFRPNGPALDTVWEKVAAATPPAKKK